MRTDGFKQKDIQSINIILELTTCLTFKVYQLLLKNN